MAKQPNSTNAWSIPSGIHWFTWCEILSTTDWSERTNAIAAGKPAQGTIALSAKHRGNHVYIMISDDGGGINDRKIRQRLIDRGVVSADVAMSMSRTDAIDFIWHPGFSTAEAVTDVSGRGVGMDIVKSRIEELTGTIEVDSVLGQGTTITLKLPLTLAIISSLLVKIRGIVFAIPMDDVREIVSVADADVLTIRDKQAFEVRGQYLPLLSIDSLLTWSSAPVAASETSDASKTSCSSNVAVLQSTGRAIGLRVDELIGSQDVVIKSFKRSFHRNSRIGWGQYSRRWNGSVDAGCGSFAYDVSAASPGDPDIVGTSKTRYIMNHSSERRPMRRMPGLDIEGSLRMGEIRVIKGTGILRTLLGSCVGLCLYDSAQRIAGLAHVVLPFSGGRNDSRGRYIDTAVKELLHQMSFHANVPLNVVGQIAGGARMFADSRNPTVGDLNLEAAKTELDRLAIRFVVRDCGGTNGRRMTIDAATGLVEVETLTSAASTRFIAKLESKALDSGVSD